MKFLPVALFFFCSLIAFAKTPPKGCNDSGQIFKACSDQNFLLKEASAKAKKEHKLLLITFGFESCPWCQSIYKISHTEEFQKKFSAQLELLEISVYKGQDPLPSGMAVLNQLSKKAGLGKVVGYPFLMMINPQTAKVIGIDTANLEQNTEKNKGHDLQKVFAAIQEAIQKTQ